VAAWRDRSPFTCRRPTDCIRSIASVSRPTVATKLGSADGFGVAEIAHAHRHGQSTTDGPVHNDCSFPSAGQWFRHRSAIDSVSPNHRLTQGRMQSPIADIVPEHMRVVGVCAQVVRERCQEIAVSCRAGERTALVVTGDE